MSAKAKLKPCKRHKIEWEDRGGMLVTGLCKKCKLRFWWDSREYRESRAKRGRK
jgi:hypothetical protein